MNQASITTQPCHTTSGRYFTILLNGWLRHNWYWILALCAAIVALSTLHTSFIYVGLILLFLVFPTLVSYLWFAYALSPACRLSILSKTVTLSREGICCTFDDKREERVAWESISRVGRTKDELTFHFSRYTFFVLPLSAFRCDAELEMFLKELLPPRLIKK